MIKRQKNQKISFARSIFLFLITVLLLVPFTVLADPLDLMRTADEKDTLYISVAQKPKLSATLKMDKNGDIVVQCLNLFSIPVAHNPLGDKPGLQKLAQRTRLHVEPKGRGVFIKLAFMF